MVGEVGIEYVEEGYLVEYLGSYEEGIPCWHVDCKSPHELIAAAIKEQGPRKECLSDFVNIRTVGEAIDFFEGQDCSVHKYTTFYCIACRQPMHDIGWFAKCENEKCKNYFKPTHEEKTFLEKHG